MDIKDAILEKLRENDNVDSVADQVAKALNNAIKAYDEEKKENAGQVAYEDSLKDLALAWNRAMVLYLDMYHKDENLDVESFLHTPESVAAMMKTAVTSAIVLEKVMRALDEAEHLEF